MKDILQLKTLRAWIKVHANSLIKTLSHIIKRGSTKVLWKLSLEKKYDPALQTILHQNNDIWLVIIRFFFSQTNLVFIDILDSFSNSLFTFLPFDFWYSTYFRCSTEFIQCPYAFFIKTGKVLSLKMFLLYLNFHETFFPVNGESNFWRW